MDKNSSKTAGLITPSKWSCKGYVDIAEGFKLSNRSDGLSEIIFDYRSAVGGMPILEASNVSGYGAVEIDIIFSETYAGIEKETGQQLHFHLRTILIHMQETALSFCFQMRWTHTEYTLKLWSRRKQRPCSNCLFPSDPRDTSGWFSKPPIRRFTFPQLATDRSGRPTLPSTHSPARIIYLTRYGRMEFGLSTLAQSKLRRPPKHGRLRNQEPGYLVNIGHHAGTVLDGEM